MNAEERAIVYRAAELIERGLEEFSCNALYQADKDSEFEFKLLATRYGDFFGKYCGYNWYDELGYEPTREQRILMLLLFAEAEGDV